MAYLNVKPCERGRVYETPADAIAHLFVFPVWSKDWRFDGAAFDRKAIAERRAIDSAIKAKDATAFVAHKRRGYWRVELAAI